MTRCLLALAGMIMALGTLGCSLLEPPAGSSLIKPTPDVTSPVDGIIVAVDAAGLTEVRGFTLRPSGSPFAFGFTLGDLENATEFPPGHLAEHQATSQPVRVFFRLENAVRVAYRLEDAPR